MGKDNKTADSDADTALDSSSPTEHGNKPAKGSLIDFFRVFGYATSFDWFLLSLMAFTSIGAGAALPTMFIVFGRIVNGLNQYATDNSSPQSFYTSNSQNSLYVVYIFIGKFFLSYASMFAVRVTGLRISSALRLAYLQALFKQPLSTIDKLSIGKVSHRITASTSTIQLGISQQLAMLIQSLSFLISFVIVGFVYNPLLAIVACASLPVTIILQSITVPIILKRHKAAEEAKEEASALAQEVFASIRVVAAFGAEALLSKRHKELIDRVILIGIRRAPLDGLYMSPTLFGTYGTSALTFYFGIKQFSRGNVSNIGEIVIVYFCIMMATTSFQKIATPILYVSQASSAAAEMFATIKTPVHATSGLIYPDSSALEDIAFENVKFSYPSRPDVQILKGLTTRFEAGKTTAIVGPSGSGKSTIVGLLERWYTLQNSSDSATSLVQKDSDEKGSHAKEGVPSSSSGIINVGQQNIEALDLQWWRRQIGFVQQEPFLFNDTIIKNISYGLCGTEWAGADLATQRKIVEDACKQAHAHDFISELPQGYDTMVGEGGIKISGGQRQRLAIARAIVKNPPILILDEATSALDVHSEQIVQKALDDVSHNRTTIIIAHRLSTIKKADKIVVMRNGRVIEEGTHDGLVAMTDGFYHSLVSAQGLALGDDGRERYDESDPPVDRLQRMVSRQKTEDINTTEKESKPVEANHVDVDIFRSFGRLLYEQRHRWWIYTICGITACINGASYPLMAYFFAKIINVFSLPNLGALVDRGNFWSLMFFIMAIVVIFSYGGLAWSAVHLSCTVSSHYQQEYFENLVRKPIVFFDAEGSSPGTLTSKLATDPQQMQSMMGVEMAVTLVGITSIVGSIIISFALGWKLALVGCLAVVPVILLAGAMRVKLEIQFDKMNSKVFESSSQFATEAVGAFRTVTALTMEDTICDRYYMLMNEHGTAALKKAVWGTLVFALSDSVDIACNALVFWYGGKLVADGEYSIFQFFVVYMAAVQSTQGAAMWFAFSPNMASATSASNRIIGSRPSKTISPSSNVSPQPSSGGAAIELSNVRFTYDTRSDPVLKGLSLSIQAGQFAALVGASGCGKSTIISLLERFYDIDSGTITYDGVDISTLNTREYRANLALVAQEPTLYEGTIRDNIALSMGETAAADEDIHEACREAHIHDFITSLPEGYATRLGPKGISLSGGQKQRITLARALLRKPRLLLLDEATSSLDSESEKQVQAAIERAAGKGQRTILAVAHRLATVQNADVIFVLGTGGKLVEKGSHAELVRARGVYFQMCQAQALDR
ncbi:ABC multidrug transporter [Pseudovirgaria hyperparasitica]|uniref:ABC multidrug transporter n=1 Tax=Pseudovirgaria hyperparasitica TaxID=470096 RepID=A0A6A6W510_9PEZI|nr:ABC multidrug transporter [Pseudovirgaria hyperparasitica]KAF2756647.1 ABC multidrug transporter [Pseudovirgaria hyperparasitica]